MDCIFCKILNGDIPSKKVYEDEFVYAFHDINPMAPVHIIVIPKLHIESANMVDQTNCTHIAKVFEAIPKVAKEVGVVEDGYRVITNIGENGGQTVKHIHFHILGGTKLANVSASVKSLFLISSSA